MEASSPKSQSSLISFYVYSLPLTCASDLPAGDILKSTKVVTKLEIFLQVQNKYD